MGVSLSSSELIDKISSTNSYTSYYKKRLRETNEDVQDFGKETESFKKSVSRLKKYEKGGITDSALERHLKDFVKKYNSMKKAYSKVDNRDIKKQMDKLDELIDDNEKALKKIGLKKDKKGKLEFDSEKYKDIKKDDIGDVLGELFEGRSSFVVKLSKLADNIGRQSESAETEIVERGLSYVTRFDPDELELSKNALNVQSKLSELTGNAESLNDNSVLAVEQKNYIKNSIDEFKKRLDDLVNGENEDIKDKLDDIKKLKEENSDSLNNIAVADDSAADDNISIDIGKYKELFNSAEDSFSTKIQGLCGDIFNIIIKPEKLGVNIIDAYA